MLNYPQFDPIALRIGFIKVHWYGIMYLVGIGMGWALALHRAKLPWNKWHSEEIADLIFYIALGVIIGGRVGYMLFYQFPDLISHPLDVFKTWQGGMSFHGGLLGVMIAIWVFCRFKHRAYWATIDFVTPFLPIGLGAGRLGNFINGELWGRVSHLPWAMVFPGAGPAPRHPSQLYEFLLEGVVLFIILWVYSKKPRPAGAVAGLFGLTYGVFRFLIEFVRQPDPQLGFVAFGWMTRGQELCIPMIIIGAGLLIWAYRKPPTNDTSSL